MQPPGKVLLCAHAASVSAHHVACNHCGSVCELEETRPEERDRGYLCGSDVLLSDKRIVVLIKAFLLHQTYGRQTGFQSAVLKCTVRFSNPVHLYHHY